MSARPEIDAAAEERLRLNVASRVAAGMMANPETFRMNGWVREVAAASVRVADALIQAVRETAR